VSEWVLVWIFTFLALFGKKQDTMGRTRKNRIKKCCNPDMNVCVAGFRR